MRTTGVSALKALLECTLASWMILHKQQNSACKHAHGALEQSKNGSAERTHPTSAQDAPIGGRLRPRP